MGVVTLLSGQPKDGVLVEARSESMGFYEEALTDSYGNYRLRGLIPGTRYTVKVARKGGLESARIERASPESLSIQVGFCELKMYLLCLMLDWCNNVQSMCSFLFLFFWSW